jgi:ABC-type uncharacterized transport system substrate-binding protein
MAIRFFALALSVICLWAATVATSQSAAAVRVAVTGESNLKTNFIESLKEAAKESGLRIDLVSKGEDPTYTLVIAQETTIASAAAAVIALDKAGDVAMSVVRSGRLSGRGALNACAKEIVKKLVVLSQ